MKGNAGTSRRLGCWGKLGLVALVLLMLEGALQILFLVQRRCPSISGVLVDRDTGKPIEGATATANVIGYSRDPLAALAANSGPFGMLPTVFTQTDREGRFSFPVRWAPFNRDEWYSDLAFGPLKRVGLSILVYSRGYIPLHSHAEGFDWTDNWKIRSSTYKGYILTVEAHPEFGHVTRHGSLGRGFTYRIEMVRAVTEEQWRLKCDETIRIAPCCKEPYATWLFNDLTAYLERWPQGERAGEYYKLVWETANLSPCNPYEQDDFARGEISSEQLKTYCDRAAQIIAFSERLNKPPAGLTEDYFRRTLEEEKRQLACGEDLLGNVGKARKGGKP